MVLRSELKQDEGQVLHVYADSLNKLTCGVGHLITADDAEHGQPAGTPITQERCDELFAYDVGKAASEVETHLPWCKTHPVEVRRALVNMCFQLGINGLLGFHNTLKHVENKEYEQAYAQGLQSKWAEQTPERARRVLGMIRSAPTT